MNTRTYSRFSIWPPFQDVPVSKTLDDLKRPKHEMMSKVVAI